MIVIRRANMDDIPKIMAFIDEHWKKGHILAEDIDFFEWQFVENRQVNMIVAVEDNKIYGIQGYIPYNHTKHPDISGSIWKTIKSGNPLLGMDMERKIKEITNFRWCGSCGLSDKALKIGLIQGMTVSRLGHFYRIGYTDNFKIAKISMLERQPYLKYEGVCFKDLNSFEKFEEIFSDDYLSSFLPYKDLLYFKNRYFLHPVYSYIVKGIQMENGAMRSALVCRKVECQGAKILKIVDFVGMEMDLEYIGFALDEWIKQEGYEFVDFYNYGLRITTLNNAGLTFRTELDENVIPNYFEPLVQKNVELNLILPWGEFRMFRGDGDQDRPSISRK